jgi:hypothetical protein
LSVAIAINIITCPVWGAKEPLSPITPTAGPAIRTIFHHTAGHHHEIENPADESLEEAIRYARDIQWSHTHPSATDPSKPWKDSGHNFLVTRAGHILQGRWGTVSQIQQRRMVVSAHCPGQNNQIGIEHEHNGAEAMTNAQRVASATLMAWIASKYQRMTILPSQPHSKYFPTACPANLVSEIAPIRYMALQILRGVDV